MPMLPPRAREDGAVDADEFAPQVHQRAAGVARIDRRVGLDEVLVAVGIDAGAPEAADDAGRDGVLQAERIADGDHEIADLESRGIAERDLDQRFGRHLEHRDVRRHVAADHGGGQIAAILQRDGDFRGVINHMGVCNYVAVFCIKDDTGARALELALAGAHVGDVEEPAEKGVLEQRVLRRALADGAAGGDVHDGRRDALDHGRERRHRGFADCGRQGGVACNRERGQCVDKGESKVFCANGHGDEDTQTMISFLLWVLLFVVCWPLAILALVLWPIVWLICAAVPAARDRRRGRVRVAARHHHAAGAGVWRRGASLTKKGDAVASPSVSVFLSGDRHVAGKGASPHTPLRGLDFDAARLGFGDLGDRELEYAVLELRLDGVGLHVLRQRESPDELAADALDARVVAIDVRAARSGARRAASARPCRRSLRCRRASRPADRRAR